MKHKYDIGDTLWMRDIAGAPCCFEVTCIELAADIIYYKGRDTGYVKEDRLSSDASAIPTAEVPGALKPGDTLWFFDSEEEQVIEQHVIRVLVWSPTEYGYHTEDRDYLAASDIHCTREAAEEEMAAYCRTCIEEARQQCQEQVDKYNGLLKSIGKEEI